MELFEEGVGILGVVMFEAQQVMISRVGTCHLVLCVCVCVCVCVEHVSSVGRSRADRSVQYMYLNPNLVAVVTESTDTLRRESSSDV